MFQGRTTKLSESVVASAATIYPKTDMILVSGTTDIATISPSFGGGFSGILFIVPTSGTVNTLTTGNIAVAVAMPVSRVTVLVYSKANGAWYPGAIS